MFGLINKIFIGLLTGLVNESNHKKCVPLSNVRLLNVRFSLLLFIYILMNTVKNFTTIHLRLH